RVLSVESTIPRDELYLASEQARLSACVLAEQALWRLGSRVASGAKAPARQSPGLKPAFSPWRARFREMNLLSHRSNPGFQPASLPSKRFSAWDCALRQVLKHLLGRGSGWSPRSLRGESVSARWT